MTLQWMLIAVGGAAVVIVAGIVWVHVQTQAAIERLDDRVAHLLAGVSLLTDTTEGALRDVAVEIGRLAAVKGTEKPRARAATQRRVATAARRGRTVQDIAASEQVSEGEVRLRLQLEKAAQRNAAEAFRQKGSGQPHASMR